MAPLKWFTSLMLAGTLVSCSPTPDTTITRRDDDVSIQFVADLIANASQVEQQQQKRFLSCTQDNSLVVNLGYAKYRGSHNPTTGLNTWKGYGHTPNHIQTLWLTLPQYSLRRPSRWKTQVAAPSAAAPEV